MIQLPENKHHTEHKPIEVLPVPQKAYISLSQHVGAPCDILDVKPGDVVKKGQRIASANAKVFAPVHSSLSGKVLAIQNWPHPVAGKGRAVVIENDGLDFSEPVKARSEEEVRSLSPAQIQRIVMEAGVVGMGGAAFPTHLKLTPVNPIKTLIINCAECEPFLTGDFRLMVEKTREIVQGIKIVAQCLRVSDILIAVEDNKPEAVERFSRECPVGSGIQVKVLKSMYPQGGEKTLIKNALKKEVPRGKLPFDIGVVVQNVGTVYAVYEAVYYHKPLYERVVTVAGSCLTNPKNLLVRIGTPIKNLIEFCGPVSEEPAKIVIGGPMMGLAQYSDSVPVIKSTTGVIFFNKKEARATTESPCIRCGACVRGCSQGLMPCMINLAVERGLWDQVGSLGVLDCVECGCCSYVCPSNRHLVQSIKRAKLTQVK